MCVLCFKTFTLAQYLKEHTYIHTQQKPFKCDYEGCNRAFRQAGKLSMHKKIHLNIIFAITRVKRNRPEQVDEIPPQAEAKSTVVLSPKKEGDSRMEPVQDKVTLAAANNDKESLQIGEDTDHELSLSREDDSDLSVISSSNCGDEERKEEVLAVNAEDGAQQDADAEGSDSESVESSDLEDAEESEYDLAAQKREEHLKLTKIFENKESKTSCVSGSKVKLPYEMLINKLVDGLETPTMIKQKTLPLPNGIASVAQPSQVSA